MNDRPIHSRPDKRAFAFARSQSGMLFSHNIRHKSWLNMCRTAYFRPPAANYYFYNPWHYAASECQTHHNIFLDVKRNAYAPLVGAHAYNKVGYSDKRKSIIKFISASMGMPLMRHSHRH